METFIDFNNKNSLYDFGLGIVDMPNLPIANEKVEYENGFTIRTDEFEDIELPIKFTKRDIDSIIDYIDDIVDWLTNIKNEKLVFSFMPDKYYIVKNVNIENITRNYYKYNTIEIVFILEPFKYLHENVIEQTSSFDINYNGTYKGKPNIKIYGTGNIQLTINNEIIQINNINNYVELDSKLYLCLNSDRTSKTRDMIGHFPILTKGINNIKWTGNISKIQILPRTAFR